MTIPFHPLADLFPLIEGAEFDALVEDVRENGILEQIVMHDGMIIDGRNRYRAGLAAGIIDPTDAGKPGMNFRSFGGIIGDDKDPLAWVLSKNLRRRHLSESQRAMVAARIARLEQGRPALYPRGDGDKPANLPDLSPVTQADAADALHVSERSVRTARKVLEEGAPEVVDAVQRGDLAVSAAAELTSLPVEAQKEAIRSADPAALYAVIKEQRAKKQAEKKERRAAREADLAEKQRALPEKRFGVIYADPEWKFEPYSQETGMDRAADNHYPTSDLADIKARDVASIAADDCVLFLWATAPMTPHALEVMASWGFTYKSHVIWRKGGDSLNLGTGYWFRNAHELLLVGTRGKVVAPAMGGQFPSVIDHPALRHSEKPERFAEMIEAYFPNLPKIELNARAARPGWDAWGYEAPETGSEAGHDGSSSGSGARPADESAPTYPAAKAGDDVNSGPAMSDAGTVVSAPELAEPVSRADAGRSASATSERMDVTSPGGENPAPDLNAIIREGYARNASIAELCALTGLKSSAVKMRAKRMGLSDPQRQIDAAIRTLAKVNAQRGNGE
jgi:N6-adenosine-specific RNA methylase IME4